MIMGKCIFEDVCDKSWCRLYSFECVDGQIYKPKTSNEQSKTRCSQCDKWGCSHRNLITDNCDLEKYETHITNRIEY